VPDVYTERDLPAVRGTIAERLARGEVAILPTDTIYGLSGNALDPAVVDRILRIKGRRRPPSLIPHAVEWARLLVPPKLRGVFEARVDEHRGPFTTIWPRGDGGAALPKALCSTGKVGLRLPDHWITELSGEIGLPLVTTSANRTQRAFMTCLDDLDEQIRAAVDFIVYQGPLPGPPSALVWIEGIHELRVEER
jgi:L-threonylcarbamoyladenylate synthase